MARKNKKKEVRFSSDDEMKPHSEAKVALYGKYLEKYLSILGVAKFISQINIFDFFCGTGVYKNGKHGSPIVAFKAIQKTKYSLSKINYASKPTNLFINDGNAKSIETASAYLQNLNKEDECCSIHVYNLQAREIIDKTIQYLKGQNSAVRSLIFIDPTGYKDIHKDDLLNLLKLKSEVVLFLPVSFMHRFKDVVQQDFDKAAYAHLRRFIYEFFEEDHPIRKEESMDVRTFINYLQDALTFDDFYASSFFLQRDKSSYYALFFITSSILGLERINDAKWEMDKVKGEGFVYEENFGQMPLFFLTPTIHFGKVKELENLLREFINNNEVCGNRNLYPYVLINGFKPSQANSILRKWQSDNILQVWDIEANKLARKNSFYLTNETFKLNESKVTFKFL